ncbi:hypothetical protein AB0B45_40275 [Nonomuraea sp. NPDC049152]|uniref:hypothetical protein n=1 Tax=Nonomuraea sp. NPDC049152 TaxID=3154350 RepID=UPI0033E41987
MSQVMVVEVPQWQGSGSATAERLVEGAGLLAAMVPDAVRHRIEVGEGDTPAALAATAGKARTVIGDVREGFVVTVGGDCGVELAPVSAAIDGTASASPSSGSTRMGTSTLLRRLPPALSTG